MRKRNRRERPGQQREGCSVPGTALQDCPSLWQYTAASASTSHGCEDLPSHPGGTTPKYQISSSSSLNGTFTAVAKTLERFISASLVLSQNSKEQRPSTKLVSELMKKMAAIHRCGPALRHSLQLNGRFLLLSIAFIRLNASGTERALRTVVYFLLVSAVVGLLQVTCSWLLAGYLKAKRLFRDSALSNIPEEKFRIYLR
jgi:hypothetical protein